MLYLKKLHYAIIVSCIFVFSVPAVFAHAHPTTYDPAPNASVKAPSTLTVRFSEELEPKFSSLSVSGPDGQPIQGQKSQVSGADKKVITLALPTLAPGTYSVHWVSVAADDGHRLQGVYKFTVR